MPADQIHHVYNRLDSSFRSGVPLIMSSAMYAWLDSHLDKAQLKKQVIATMYAAFVKDMSAEIAESNTEIDENGNPVQGEITPGTVYHLDSGKDIVFPNPPSTSDYPNFDKSVLHKIAAATGLTYETLSTDYSETNYSSSRQSSIKSGRIIDILRKNILIDKFIRPVCADFINYLHMMAIVDKSGLNYKLITPEPVIIDPAKEINPKTVAIRAGLRSWSEQVSSNGDDPEEVAKQIQRDYALFDDYGLSLDIDGRRVDKNGNLFQEESADGSQTPDDPRAD